MLASHQSLEPREAHCEGQQTDAKENRTGPESITGWFRPERQRMQQAGARLNNVTVYIYGVQVVDAHFGYTHLLCSTLWKSGENAKLDRRNVRTTICKESDTSLSHVAALPSIPPQPTAH